MARAAKQSRPSSIETSFVEELLTDMNMNTMNEELEALIQQWRNEGAEWNSVFAVLTHRLAYVIAAYSHNPSFPGIAMKQLGKVIHEYQAELDENQKWH